MTDDNRNLSRLAGRRYACLVRCSTDPQAEKSIPDQQKVLHEYAARQGMIHAGAAADFLLEGISGSHPAARTDIEQIIRRKQTYDDFDVLLVQDMSRLTRGGVEHGGKVEFDLAAHGIKVVFAGSQLPDGDHAGIVKSVEYYAAQQYAKAVSFAVARGQMSAILDGRQPHCLRPPYAVDRLYVSADGRPLHVVRNRTDGSQVKLDPQTLAVLQTYPRPVKGKTPVRCRKQAGERVVLILGDPQHVEAVRRMFRRVLIDGWGDWRVARELNDAGIPSPNGKRWTRRAVTVILRNPIYTGFAFANRRTAARYHERSPNAPRKVDYDLTDVARNKRPKNDRRPRDEWQRVEYPTLAEFLDPELRERVVEYQRRFLTGAAPQPPAKKDKHVDSRFVLKHLLRSKQGNYPMTGRTQGSKEKPYRYYHVSAPSAAYPSSDGLMRRTVPAVPVERAVLGVIRETLLQSGVRDQMLGIIRGELEAQGEDAQQVEAWRRERETVREQIEFVVEELGTIGREAAKRKVRQLESRLATLDQQIERAGAARRTMTEAEVNELADAVTERLQRLPEEMETMPSQALRTLIAGMVTRLEVDLETRSMEIEVALPQWVTPQNRDFDARMGVGENFLQRVCVEAQYGRAAILAAYECVQPSRDCYDCRRRRAA